MVGVHNPDASGQEPLYAEGAGQGLQGGAAVGQIGEQGEEPALEGLGVPQGGEGLVEGLAVLQGGGQGGAAKGADPRGSSLAGKVKVAALRGQEDGGGDHRHRAGILGQKFRHAAGNARVPGGYKDSVLGEAGRGGGLVARVADYKKAFHAGMAESLGQPEGRRIKQNVLEKQGGAGFIPFST